MLQLQCPPMALCLNAPAELHLGGCGAFVRLGLAGGGELLGVGLVVYWDLFLVSSLPLVAVDCER